MRESLAFVVLACACGVAARRGPALAPPPEPAQPREPSPRGDAAVQDAGNAFFAIEERWAPYVPGMHVMATRESGPQYVELVRADPQDLCVRVAFQSSEPVVASLVDALGATLAASAERTTGILADQGPVCIRKGNAIRAAATGPATARVLWVAWGAP